MVTVNILVYTDSKDFALGGPLDGKGLNILKQLLEQKTLAFCDFKLDVKNRYEGFSDNGPNPAMNKLTDDLLKKYDELWVFGWYQQKVDTPFRMNFGGPENELDDDERRALEAWMAKGGVLISGDHSDRGPTGVQGDLKTYKCLGRAIGHRIPRAGQLRAWEGPPSGDASSSFNTLVRIDAGNDTAELFQKDSSPQPLILVSFPLPDGAPSEELKPTDLSSEREAHQIFFGIDVKGDPVKIDFLPDHQHEGRVEIPKILGDDWPPLGNEEQKRRPVVVAYGCDKRHCANSPVLALYDGDGLGVGRIAADSSWHHFVDVNLKGFNVGPGSVLDRLRQFYCNLALYLAPLEKRKQMAQDMLFWLLDHPEVKEEFGNDALTIGKVAIQHLSRLTTRCEIVELLQLSIPLTSKPKNEALNFPRITQGLRELPSLELVVGSIIKNHFATPLPSHMHFLNVSAPDSPSRTGMKKALERHRDHVAKIIEKNAKHLERFQ